MSETPLIFERSAGVARLTLNRPQQGNAVDLTLARALREAAIECDQDASIRCVVLTGAGRMFSVGGDIGAFAGVGDRFPVMLTELTADLHVAVTHLARMAKPLVTAINGTAAGAGLALAMLGDLALAAQSSQFTLAYGGVGLTPDGGASWLLPRLVGLRRAQELALTNKRVSADEAAALGMVTRVVDDSALADEADRVAAELARAATRAIGRTRTLLLHSFETSLETQLELEARAIAAAGRDAESREGIAAFLAKRKPNFAD